MAAQAHHATHALHPLCEWFKANAPRFFAQFANQPLKRFMPKKSNFAAHIVQWQRQFGRHDLPWQNTTDAYKIWLSEIMLQQTQVATVKTYYANFLQHFPDVNALAAAPLDQVLALWAGLGYYSRARNLHHCAQTVASQWQGRFPERPEQLITLKGVGASTAAAIAVFAYGASAAILDGNVKRVLSRRFGVDAAPSAANDKWLLGIAQRELFNAADAKALDMNLAAGLKSYTQGLMDLGASLCSRSKALCHACPLQNECVALARGLVADLPRKKAKTIVPIVHLTFFIYRHNGHLWLEPRPAAGIWAQLYAFPENAAHMHAAQPKALPAMSHKLTHRLLKIETWLIDVSSEEALTFAKNRAGVWVSSENQADFGTPKPVQDLINHLFSI
jgi:A/G-specific adenine glycosylase